MKNRIFFGYIQYKGDFVADLAKESIKYRHASSKKATIRWLKLIF